MIVSPRAEVDLHTHSNASDGSLSPEQLIREAAGVGLKALALTDHDTIQGLPEALAAGRRFKVEVIPGCELAVDVPRGFMHILGLWLPQEPVWLLESMAYLQKRRQARNREMIAALQRLNIEIDEQEVKAMTGGGTMGRVHMARLLVEKQVVPDMQQAFAQYIGSQGKAYVSKDKLQPAEAIRVLKKEGATVVLAHPYSLELSPAELFTTVAELQAAGLDGLEVFYPEHTLAQTEFYQGLCRSNDLLLSGGSDFHGLGRPEVRLGRGKDQLDLPYTLVKAMKKRRQEQGLWVTSAIGA